MKEYKRNNVADMYDLKRSPELNLTDCGEVADSRHEGEKKEKKKSSLL